VDQTQGNKEDAMQEEKMIDIIESAIKKTAEMNPQETDGKWLEVVAVESGPFIKEGTDSLSAVAFVEARKRPIDFMQAVGRTR